MKYEQASLPRRAIASVFNATSTIGQRIFGSAIVTGLAFLGSAGVLFLGHAAGSPAVEAAARSVVQNTFWLTLGLACLGTATAGLSGMALKSAVGNTDEYFESRTAAINAPAPV
jgi:hypothetical protein